MAKAKDNTNQEQDPQPDTAPLATDHYYFSNIGVGQPYAVEAKNQEEAMRLNQKYLESINKESS